ncbi:MAG: glycosyltransferase family 2 protein [Candidatus Pacebacteria bacterium]|nr:glycosyltransferase family 2 protein [Candidatus Paceibacterota bacterium]
MYLSVIIPAYNEEKRIDKTLRGVHSHLSKQKYSYEIIVVDDGSKDGTTKVVTALSIPGLRLIHYEKNWGKGYAVKKGMLEAKGDYRLFMDADNSTAIEHIDSFLPYFLKGADIVIGSRRVAGAHISLKQSAIREFLGSIFRLSTKIIIPLQIKDSQNGFKAFSAKAAELLFSKETIFGLAFDIEILALARKYGMKIEEVPIEWKNDDQSRLSGGKMLKAVGEVCKIRYQLWAGTYGNFPAIHK